MTPFRPSLHTLGEQALIFHAESVKATLATVDAAAEQGTAALGAWRSAYRAHSDAAAAMARVYVEAVQPAKEA